MKLLNLAAIGGLSILASACATGATTTTTGAYFYKVGVPDIFTYVAADRDFRTVIFGNPGAASKSDFDASVMAAMPDATNGRVTNFTTSPSSDSAEGYRLVMVFSGDSRYSVGAACKDADYAALKPVSGTVELQAAFCYREDVLSEVHVAYPQGSGALKDAVSQVVLNLFPRIDPLNHPDPNGGNNLL